MVKMYFITVLILGVYAPLTNGRCKITELFWWGILNFIFGQLGGGGGPLKL